MRTDLHGMAWRSSAIFVAVFAAATARADPWPAFRGASGVGVVDGSIPATWSETQNVRWRVPLPDRGNSTPAVWGDRVFVTQAIETEHRRMVMCFNRSDGKLLWQKGTKYERPEPTNRQNPYCGASPATDGKHVVACFGSPGLYCYDLDGNELWHRDLGVADSAHGGGSSPIIYGGLCIVNFGPGTNAALVACDLNTGEVAWRVTPPKIGGGGFFGAGLGFRGAGGPTTSPSRRNTEEDFAGARMALDFSGTGGFRGSWSTPVVYRVSDHDELLVAHPLQVSGYDPKTGKELWSCKGLPEQVITSPAVGEGVLVASGHVSPVGASVMAVKLGGQGDVTTTHKLWQIKLSKECIGSGVITGGCVYLIEDNCSVVCLDLKTGQKKWENRLTGKGSVKGSWSSLLLNDGKLYATNQSGEVFILKAAPEFELLKINAIAEETTCASLAVAEGQILLRTHEALWCLGK